MATRTKPFVTAATLASAAAIAVATPAIAPSLNLPSPHALAAAQVQLATFADVLSVPSVEWTDLLFGNTTWGNVLSSTNYGAPAAKPQDVLGQAGYVNPWATYCAAGCNRSGITGAAYLFFDALVNGNGKGYNNSNQWSTGIVNYFWEPNATIQVGSGGGSYLNFVSAGFSAATWYALQTTLGKAVPTSLLPALSVALATPFWGPHIVTIGYSAALTSVAALLSVVPGVGKFAGNSILAYLGSLPIPNSGGSYYQKGLSGALNYWTDIVTGSVPFPAAATPAASALAAAATPAAPAAAAATLAASETSAVSKEVKPAAAAAESTPAPKVPESTPAASVSDSSPAAKAPEIESTPAVNAPESTPAAETPAVSAPESTPAVTETKPASVPDVSVPDAPAAVDTGGRPGPAKAAPKHPVRDAVEKVTKQITSAINGAKSAKADSAS